MKLIPRDYQNEAVYSIFRYFEEYKAASGNPLVVLPTGTGKSLVIALFFELLLKWWGNQRVMCVTHVKELVQQNYEKLINIWPEAPAGIYSAGLKRKDTHHQIIYAGIASVAKKAHLFGDVSIVLVDEAHLISLKDNPKKQTMYKRFFDDLRRINPLLKIVGLTATDYRLGFGPIVKQEGDDELGIETLFDSKVFDGSSVEFFNWFISEGYLLPVVPKRTKMQIDTSGVKKAGGEFIASELQNVANKAEANEAAIEEALMYGENRKAWLVFGSGVQHCLDLAFMLNAKGIPAAAVHSSMGDAERDRVIRDFKSGKLRAVTNYGVLTTGFDHPAIDMILMLRPTASPVLWIQMLGRGTRPNYMPGYDLSDREQRLLAIQESEKHDCLVLDYSGNSRRLGPINDPAIPNRPGVKGAGAAIYKCCDYCATDGQYPAWRFCGGVSCDDPAYMPGGTYCGKPFTFKEKLKKAASTEVLIKESLPIVEVHNVQDIVYQKHLNKSHPEKPPTLRVTYHCGTKSFSEFVCLMHSDWAGRKAYKWWKNRTTLPLPDSIDNALEIISMLKIPTQIKVQTNEKFPVILNCCYDGSSFGTLPTAETEIGIQVYTKDNIISSKPAAGNIYDDDNFNHEALVEMTTPSSLFIHKASDAYDDEDVPF